MERASVIARSGTCSAQWLSDLLPPLWFGGDYECMVDAWRQDCHLVRYDWRGERVNVGLS